MITIKKAEIGDLFYVLDLRREMLAEINVCDQDIFDGEFMEKSEDYFRHEDQTTVLAYEDDEVIGCATICYIKVMPTYNHPTGSRAHIMNVYTRVEYRRRGVAHKMVSALIDEAIERGVTRVTLDSTESGKPLYEALGFDSAKEFMELSFEKL